MSQVSCVMSRVREFASQHLYELAQEMVEFENSGLLCDGRLRELEAIARPVCNSDALKVAQATVRRAALEYVVTMGEFPK